MRESGIVQLDEKPKLTLRIVIDFTRPVCWM